MARRAEAGSTTDGDSDRDPEVRAAAGGEAGATSDLGAEPGPAGAGASGNSAGVGSWARRRLRAAAAWVLVGPPALWLVVRASSLGRGTTVETFIVFTPYVALASIVVLGVTAALRVRPAALAAAGCCAGFALVIAPLFLAAGGPSPAPTGPDLRVMTSNVQFGWADAATVVRLVEEGDIDILGVQELTPEFHRRLVAEGIEDLLSHGVVDARSGASGTGLYSRHPVERVGPDSPGGDIPGRHANPTGVVDVPGAPPVQVTVVHPMPPVGAGAVDAWQETLSALPRPDGDEGPVHLLIGDFNATVDQPTMRALLDDGYTDAALARGRGWEPTWRSRGVGPALTIDHVLVDGTTAVERVSVHDVPGSDHRALVAELRMPEEH
jgi:endonuclease/exonuclease/phosphatase family metal-dependent hydrolase